MGLIRQGNCAFEGFDEKQLTYAKQAWMRAAEGSSRAARGILQFKKKDDAAKIRRWFGLSPQSNPSHAQLLMVAATKAQEVNKAITTRPITLAYRPNLSARHQEVYGYVWDHLAGSGFRIILGKWFMCDPDPYEASQTIYHELTHKVCKTEDHEYGVQDCLALASTNPRKAVENADSYGYFMKNYLVKM